MGAINVLSCCLLLALLVPFTPAYAARLSVEEHRLKFHQMAAQRDVNLTHQLARVFYPISYGADPTGTVESSDAIQSAIHDAYETKTTRQLMQGISDLGGVVIDLQGGNYKISKPIRIPPNSGNILIHGGTIRASDDFPVDGYLIELQLPNAARLPKTSSIAPSDFFNMKVAGNSYHYEDITLRDIFFDSNYRGGGVIVVNAVRTRIDNCFFAHFGTEGILVEKGHETFISDTFLGQHLTAGSDPHERNFSGVAIDLASNDNVITDVAIFSAATGVILRGQANILTGLHCYNKATYWGGVGVLVKLAGLAQTRISNSYMDYTAIVVEDPVQFHVTNSFFLGDANIVLKSIKGHISGLNIVDNMFSGSGWVPIISLNESNGPFTKIDQVVVDRNNVRGMQLKTTVSKRAVAAVASRWVANFTDLVFRNRINNVQYSLFVKGENATIPVHAITGVSDNVVVVESKNVVDGVVSVMVDQNAGPGETSKYS